jgi:sterol desaturase/sphingolipid hydroxylase (fatty acid hydroxylase superfamily)
MQYEIAMGVALSSFGMALAGCGAAWSALLGIGIATFAWPAVEYINHVSLHTYNAPRHMYHHQRSRDYPEIRVNLSPIAITGHLAVMFGLGWLLSEVAAITYSGTFALLYACYEGWHETGHLVGEQLPMLSWAIQNSHAWHWHHHVKPNRNYGVSTPGWDICSGTADQKMSERYIEGWRKWLLPVPWVVFALTEPDPTAPYDKKTEEERRSRQAADRFRRSQKDN